MTARHSSPVQSRPAWSCWGRGIAAIPIDPSCVGWTIVGAPVRVLDDGTISAAGVALARWCASRRGDERRQCSGERDACGAEVTPIALIWHDKPARPGVYDLALALCSAIATASDLRARVADWRDYDCATIEVRHATARGRAAFDLHEYRRGSAWLDGWTEAPIAVHEIVRVALATAQKRQAGG